MKFEKQPNRCRRISRMTLLMLAADSSFSFVLGYIFVLDLLLLLFCILGGVPAAACVLLLLLCSWGIFAFALQSSFRAKCGWCNVSFMRKLLKQKDMIRRLNQMTLTNRNGGWEYSDSEWFIRVGRGSACILFAPDVDFSAPAVHAVHTLYDDFTRQRKYAESKEFHRYTLRLKDQSEMTVQLDRLDQFLRWMKAQGGSTVWKEMSRQHGTAD